MNGKVTTATEMADAVGIKPKAFRQALRAEQFDWHSQNSAWEVQTKSPEHLEMQRVLKTLLTKKAPGKDVTPFGVYLLAQCYRANADALEKAVQMHTRFSDHPRRLLYFQALEHFLRCFLLIDDRKTLEDIRSNNHNFAVLLDESKVHGLRVSKDTEKFIRSRTLANDYVHVRYDISLENLDGNKLVRPPTMNALEQTVWELEHAVGLAMLATGREVIPNPLEPQTKARR